MLKLITSSVVFLALASCGGGSSDTGTVLGLPLPHKSCWTSALPLDIQ